MMTANPPPDSPLISVITVCLNAERFLDQTIQSVLGQTYPHIEYIIIDGGSKDGTVDIIRKHESRLTYWHSKPDRGLAHAFNLGLEQVHGEWILFLNSDDFFLNPSVIHKMVPHLLYNNNVDVVFGATIYFTNQVNPVPAPMRKFYGSPWRWRDFRWSDTIPHPSAFTNRRFFNRVKGFDEAFRIAVDYDFFLRGHKTFRAEYIAIPISGMREEGLSGRNMLQNFREGRMAHLKNKALPPWAAWLNFFWQFGRYYLGRIGHKILDPLARYVHWTGRNTKQTYQKYS
jgi:glycosyltransferase involved in cell wall biosynthesis